MHSVTRTKTNLKNPLLTSSVYHVVLYSGSSHDGQIDSYHGFKNDDTHTVNTLIVYLQADGETPRE